MSKQKEPQKEKLTEVKESDKNEAKPSSPTDRDHYVYESIIAEIGY